MQKDEILSNKEQEDLAKILNIKYASQLKDRSFFIEISSGYKTMAEVSLTLKNKTESFYYPVKARIDLESNKMKKREAALFLLDYIEMYFEEYFENSEDTFLPIDWSNFSFEGSDFQMCGQIHNLNREKEADQIIAKANQQSPVLETKAFENQ